MPTALEVKTEILKRCSPRKQATVERLWDVLETMGRKGSQVFTTAIVARECAATGILQQSSIYNAGGEDYRTLIKAYADGLGAKTVGTARAQSSPLEQAIDGLKDLDVKTRLRAIIAENKNLHAENDRLKGALKHYQPVPKDRGVGESSRIEVLLPERPLVDIAPLQKFLSPDWLKDNRWQVDESFAIRMEDGTRLTPVGFATALASAIRALS